MEKYLIFIMLLLTSCIGASGEPVVVMTQSEYDKRIRGAVVAGRYSLCIQNLPLNHCREDYENFGKSHPNERTMSLEDRHAHTKAAHSFIDSMYDDTNGIEYEQWEQWNLR